ncbi:cysteinyl-tRNA synthetase [bacterium]|nr:cysteinyl-tRNA synthetase [bacterium]
MAPLHRSIVASLPKRSTPSSLVALDGSYDFQTNRAEMGEKIAVFFRSKVGIPTTVIGLPETDRAGADLAPSALAPTIAGLNAADLIFLGPGSPSRALRRWGGTPIVDQVVGRIQNGATLITSSAAAAASGRCTIPVYEIYKAGTNPVWLDGLDIIGALTGLAVAVVPHWNNNEGATHDTSRCFIGESRLQQLERALPVGTAILGIDEHTALTIDLGADNVSVHGKGAITIRIPGIGETAMHSGATESLATFVARFGAAASAPRLSAAPTEAVLPTPAPVTGSDVTAAVEQLIALRATARAERRFSDADALRAAIEALGVELVDEPTGARWSLRA